jgi:hypothetical protein
VQGGKALLLKHGLLPSDIEGYRQFSIPVCYELRKTASGWTVWDTATGTPATVDGVWQVGLEIQTADDLTDSLNWLARACAIERRMTERDG